MKLIIKQFFFYLMLLGYLNSNAQNTDCPVFLLANDLSSPIAEFKAVVNESKGFDAWRLLNKEKPTLRTNIEELTLVSKNLDDITNAGGYLKWKTVQGAGNVALDVATATEKQLDDIFAGLQNSPPFKYAPNTLEHKAERWAQYKIEKGAAAKDYSNWSNIYNSNMTKATKAHQAADEVMASIGWGQREVTVQAGTYTRRMDIADKVAKKGMEVKSYETGKVYATEAIKGELNADKYLIDNDFWQIEWVFKGCEPSQPLRTLLEQGGITIKLVP